MYITNPTFTVGGDIGVARRNIGCSVPEELLNATYTILRSLQLLTALRHLQEPQRGDFIDDNIAGTLQRSISDLLLQAAAETRSPALSEHLKSRSDAFLTRDFTQAALAYAAQKDLPLELIIGPIPSWRFASHPRLYAGILAVPDESEALLLSMIDEQASKLAAELSLSSNLPPLQPGQPAPHFIVCDLLGLGGDTLSHPIHMANFLPDDEGIYKRVSNKSIIYRNVYTTRYQAVSVPLAQRCHGSRLLDHLPTDEHSWLHLITWFRGHDIGHTYFDQHCKALSGFPKFKRYVLQETLADLFGLLLSIRFFELAPYMCSDEGHQLTVFLSEMLRFLKRDRQLFPDASAAWFQLSSCIEARVIEFDSEGRLDGDPQEIKSFLKKWFEGFVTQLVHKEAAYLETILTSRCGFIPEGVQPLPETIDRLLNKPVQCTEVDPILVGADQIVEQLAVPTKEVITTLREAPATSEYRHCRRF